MEENLLVYVQVDDKEEGGLDLLLGLEQETTIDEKVNAHACLENVDQSKFKSALERLQIQKITENHQFPMTVAKVHSVLSNDGHQKYEKNGKPKVEC